MPTLSIDRAYDVCPRARLEQCSQVVFDLEGSISRINERLNKLHMDTEDREYALPDDVTLAEAQVAINHSEVVRLRTLAHDITEMLDSAVSLVEVACRMAGKREKNQ